MLTHSKGKFSTFISEKVFDFLHEELQASPYQFLGFYLMQKHFASKSKNAPFGWSTIV